MIDLYLYLIYINKFLIVNNFFYIYIMKKILDEYKYNIFYEVDDLSEFGENVTMDDFEKIKEKKIVFVNDLYDIMVIELEKNESFYKFKNDNDILLLKSGDKIFESSWNGNVLNVLNMGVDDYDVEMLDKIRKTGITKCILQF